MSYQRLRLFVDTENSDYDHRESTRTISGRLTKKRYDVIRKYMKQYNRKNRAPYGISERGYAYSCGCERDCCGCLISAQMQLDFIGLGANLTKVVLTIGQSFNY